MKMQLLYGAFPVIKGKGFAAKAVADMLEEMGNELGSDPVEVEPKFDELILIDREVLLLTPPPPQAHASAHTPPYPAPPRRRFRAAPPDVNRRPRPAPRQVDLITPMVTPLTVRCPPTLPSISSGATGARKRRAGRGAPAGGCP